MSALKQFLAVAKSTPNIVTLRGVFPGRGSMATKNRADVKAAFNGNDEIDGVTYDRKQGVFYRAAKSLIA